MLDRRWLRFWSYLSVQIAAIIFAAILLAGAVAIWGGVVPGIGVAVIAGIAGAVGVNLLTTRPLRALVTAARRIQENDLQSAVPATGPREFRQLGSALDEMREAIRVAREELIGVNVGLSRSIEASAANLSAATLELSVIHTIAARLSNRGREGIPAATEDLTRLAWVDGAVVALEGEDGELSAVAAHGLAPHVVEAALASLQHTWQPHELEEGVFIESIMDHPGVASALVDAVGGLAAIGLRNGRGIGGLMVVTNTSPIDLPEARRSVLRSIGNEMAVTIERSALASQVEESRRLAESVLREMSDGMIVLDAQDRCRVCNPAAEQMLRIDRWETLGQPAAEWLAIPADDLETLRARAVGDSEDSYLPVIVEVGGREIAVTASRFVDAGSADTGLILLLRDLTEGATAERMKQDFVSMVGHELRTPLTLIRASIDLLSEEGAGTLTPTQMRITDVLRTNSDRLLNLINDLLDMSALDSGRLQVRPVTINLAEVVLDTLESHRRDAEEHRVELSADLEAPGIPVWADRGRIRQVLSNLVTNAVKYTPAGGHVTVRVTAGNPSVRVDVEDDGIGVPRAEQEQLFQKFYRARSGQRQSGGTGLGLAIARSIVELHGGEIWCESDGKTGSTFSFTLPRRRTDDGYVAY